MGERIQVGVGDPVVADRNLVRSNGQHLDFVGIGIIDRLDGVGVACHGYREALLHQRRRLLALGRCDQVQGADLILPAPASPVRQIFLPALVLRFGYRMRGRGRHCLG